MSRQLTFTGDMHAAVRTEFANRPTLRQVASLQVLQVLVDRHPVLASAALPDAECLSLLIPNDSATLAVPYDSWSSRPLIDCVLEAMRQGRSLTSLGAAQGEFLVSVVLPYRLHDAAGNALSYMSISITSAMEALEGLILALPEHFVQAQVDYWLASGRLGVSRECWLRQMLRSALLQNLPLQGLNASQRQCVLGLLKGGGQQPEVFAVAVEVVRGEDSRTLLLPDLLVRGERDDGEDILWCAPSSVVQAFGSYDEYAQALCASLAQRHEFDTMRWSRYALEGDCFAQQCTLLLECQLGPIGRLREGWFADVAAMEQAYAELSDPAQWFIEGYCVASERGIVPPPGLRKAMASDSFAFQVGLFDLALAEAQSEGGGALDDILDLHSYASQQLRARMLADHPVDANYFSDDLQLTMVSVRGMPGGAGVGPGDGAVEHRSMSLTEFAIANLVALQGATLTGVSHRDGQLLMDWMTPRYLKRLVEQVDIGANYPVYLRQRLDDPATRNLRIERFAREWRCSLLFSALSARIDGALSEAALQCVGDYCRASLDPVLPASLLMPLAFKRDADVTEADVVTGMYVLFSVEPAVVLLYRPLYGNAAVTEYDSLEGMMAAIRQPGALQDSILTWLPDPARRVYENGGFSEPHLGRPILDTTVLPAPVAPASFSARFWNADVDVFMYKANRDLLLTLADRQSVSNAESRWAILTQGAWLLFDVVAVLLRGPVATVAWLAQALVGLRPDIAALREGTGFERSAAVVDLVMNLSMALLHVRMPSSTSSAVSRTTRWRSWRRELSARLSMPVVVEGKVGLPGAMGDQVATELDFTWRGTQGFNGLPPERREALRALRSSVSVNGLQPLGSGREQGLYIIAQRRYVVLGGDVYQVRAESNGVRIVGVEGGLGPWLAFEYGQWRIDPGLRLAGGMPQTRRDKLREENQRRIEQLRAQEIEYAQRHNALAIPLNKLREFMLKKEGEISALEAIDAPDDLAGSELQSLRELHRKTRVKLIYALKDLIENTIEHDRVMDELFATKQSEVAFASALDDQRSRVRQGLIDSLSSFYNELATVINTEGVDTLSEQIAVHPEGRVEIALYERFRSGLENVVKWETDLVEVSRILDRQLEATLKDDSIYFRDDETGDRINKQVELKGLIEKRRESGIDLQFRLLQDLAESSLDRLADVEERVLRDYHDYLADSSLVSAGNAHGDLAASNLPLPERMEVLTGVLEAYEEASTMADYLRSVGGAAIRSESLQAYQKVLGELKHSAEQDLEEAIRERELEEPHTSRSAVYAPRGGRRRLVRTSRGRSVLGEEVEVDGVAVVQQRDYRTQHVLKTFRRQGQQWVEDSAGADSEQHAPFSPLEPRIARKRAQSLIDQVDSVISLARGYVKANEPLSLSTVIDGHVEKLQEAQASLPRLTPEDELFEALGEASDRLRSISRDLLTGLYLSTSRPNAASLRFLLKQQQVSIQQVAPRKKLATGDYLDVYEVRRLPRAGQSIGDGLWEMHFHYPDESTPRSAFSKGHLKLWAQRKLGRQAQMRAAISGRDLLEIYRGGLRLGDLEGIISFD